ncbi:hypothetical protein HBA55_29800 [Pseudomaricurvus alkylphenolicus]|uniref:hypothetical protein n=1 Tax=Pseudomaricurvus alkylphenolicus TaxID=1306991 RepID=UPI00141E650F|nr:hypothetical protein [Pseudomaricurvus alkylphenolicus]NIB43834.1 hypothetical protein [Pseudomaricurvus alkylphenolicus]
MTDDVIAEITRQAAMHGCVAYQVSEHGIVIIPREEFRNTDSGQEDCSQLEVEPLLGFYEGFRYIESPPPEIEVPKELLPPPRSRGKGKKRKPWERGYW